MPHPASSVEASSWLRLLVLGGPKAGKTRTVIATAPGHKYVINSDDKHSLKSAALVTKDFTFDLALGDDLQVIEGCISEARKGVKEKRYQTIVWDTMTKYAYRCEQTCAAATENAKGEPDGRRYWQVYRKHLHNIIDRLFMLNAHVIVNAHWIEMTGPSIDGQAPKVGAGIVPMLGGAARQTIPADFQDVVFLEKRKVGTEDKRFFVTSSAGVWGPGCRNLSGVTEVEADVSKLWERMQGK